MIEIILYILAAVFAALAMIGVTSPPRINFLSAAVMFLAAGHFVGRLHGVP